MALASGQRLGAYEVLGSLGAGGMGEVYRARDTKLQRDVAIKVLPEPLATDRDRLARFEREAQLLAALNHPHIAAIYGVDTVADTQFLVLELVDGETLSDRVARGGALAISEAVAIARQIAEALQAAHDKGIIHRDLKPANIALTADGQVKVLDFGLAKAMETAPAAQSSLPGATLSPTLSLAMTEAGFILGTAAYMSPEQAKGRPADKRSDVWAFGCVLFEMLTGKRAFEGEDASDTLAGILRGDPDWKALPRSTPGHLREILTGCLAKDRKQRLADIAVVNYLLTEPRHVTRAPSLTGRKVAFFGGAGVTLLAAAVGLTWWFSRTPEIGASLTRFVIVPPTDAPIAPTNTDRQLAISPDGLRVAYVASQGQLMLRHLGEFDVKPLGGVPNARYPFWSHDAKWIGYTAGNFDLRKVPIIGGASVLLTRTSAPPRGASWAPDDTIIFATADTSTGLMSIPAGGGTDPKVLTKPDPARGEQDHVHPHHLPGGRAVLFSVMGTSLLENAQIAVLNLETNERKALIRGGSNPEYAEPGFIVYAVAGALRAVRFDVDTLSVMGDPVPVLDQVAMLPNGVTQFGISGTGALVYMPGGASGVNAVRTLAWIDRASGKQLPIAGAMPRAYQYPRLSPDDSRVALTIDDQQRDIWIFDFGAQTLRQVTFGPAVDQQATWFPSGDRILFSSARNGPGNLYSQRTDGTGTAERLTDSRDNQVTTTMSPDGRLVVLLEQRVTTGNDLMLLRLNADAGADARGRPQAPPLKSAPLIASMTTEAHPEISPDGRFLVFMSNETGQPQIVVKPFPDLNGEWRVTSEGGSRPVWSRAGRELFYAAPSGAIMAVPVALNPTFSFGSPKKLFDWPTLAVPGLARTFDVSRDGRRFLMIKESDSGRDNAQAAPIHVVLNWVEELKEKLP